MKKHILLLCIVIFCILKTQSQTADKTLFQRTDAYVAELMGKQNIVGLNYAVLIDNKLVHQESFGLASAQLNVPMTLDKVFPVASISKLFSSTALHKLLQEQNRSVEETVADFLPNRTDLPESWRALTLKQLLSHTSGIPDQIDYGVFLAPESDAYVINAIKDKPFSSEPGTESKYNATGFLLVRLIIEQLAQQDFESFMQAQYFDKMNLSSAQYGGFKKVIKNRVTCYQNINGELEMFPLNHSSSSYAGAGLNINMTDLVSWFQTVINGDIINQKELQNIWTPVILNNGKDGHFGLGWEAYNLYDGLRMVGHGGAGISSFRHYYNTSTNKSVTIILLTNGALDWTLRPNHINAQLVSMILPE